MAKPITADQLIKQLKAIGLPYIEYPGWRSRGVDRMRTKGFSPRGICIHHTAGNLGRRTVRQYIADIINGDRKVPDKANVVIGPDGDLWLNAAGRANHIVYYSAKAMDRILAGNLPTSGSVNLRGSSQNMNGYAYGVEIIAAGTPNAKQRATAVKWAAALCLFHGWSGGEVFGHGEIAYDRDWSDPGFNMGEFRRDVMALVKAKGKPSGGVSKPTTGGVAKPKPKPGGVAPAKPKPKPGGVAPAKPKPATLRVADLKKARYADPPKKGNPKGPFWQQVRLLQQALIKLGYLVKGADDGHYGTRTVAAVQAVQRRAPGSRNPDGWVGPTELAWIKKAAKASWPVG